MLYRRLSEYFRFLKSLWRTVVRLIWGMWKLTALPHPAITIFGGSRVAVDSEIAKKTAQLTKLLAADGFSIITGGGPGIMEAANLGAMEHLKECEHNGVKCINHVVSAGIGLLRLNQDKVNPYVQKYIAMEHFFSRKWLLVRYSVGFIVFPGGFGTLDELFEIVTLIQCNRMAKLPVILFDRLYWSPLIDWIETRAMKYKFIGESDAAIIYVTDSVQDAYELIKKSCKEQKESVLQNGFNGTK
jgi:uncharacterized protein (TIGR00730 family)